MAACYILTSISLFSLLTQSSSSQTTSNSHPSKTTTIFDNCNHLPNLNAFLRWTYHPSPSSLSIAFTARPATPTGWTAWALNPTSLGMLGAQALIAFRPNFGGPVSVDTYNIQSYTKLTKGPISYNVTGISAEESAAGEITIFATWALPMGEPTVNQLWQVGPVVNGRLSTHAFGESNLKSMMKLNLVTGPSSFSVPCPTDSPDSPATEEFSPPQRTGAGEALLSGKSFGVSVICALGVFLLFLL